MVYELSRIPKHITPRNMCNCRLLRIVNKIAADVRETTIYNFLDIISPNELTMFDHNPSITTFSIHCRLIQFVPFSIQLLCAIKRIRIELFNLIASLKNAIECEKMASHALLFKIIRLEAFNDLKRFSIFSVKMSHEKYSFSVWNEKNEFWTQSDKNSTEKNVYDFAMELFISENIWVK